MFTNRKQAPKRERPVSNLSVGSGMVEVLPGVPFFKLIAPIDLTILSVVVDCTSEDSINISAVIRQGEAVATNAFLLTKGINEVRLTTRVAAKGVVELVADKPCSLTYSFLYRVGV